MYTYEEIFEEIAGHIAAILGYSLGLSVLLQFWSIARTFLELCWKNVCKSLEHWWSQPIPPHLCTKPGLKTISAYIVQFMHIAWLIEGLSLYLHMNIKEYKTPKITRTALSLEVAQFIHDLAKPSSSVIHVAQFMHTRVSTVSGVQKVVPQPRYSQSYNYVH